MSYIAEHQSLTYLVTGGCGFIGTHLTQALAEQSHHVIVLDNLSTGRSKELPSNVKLIVGDIRDQALVNNLMREVDGCFHLAAAVSVELCHHEWIQSNQINLGGSLNVLNAARFGRLGKPIPVVYASSAAIYGDNPLLPLTESAQPQPRNAYGVDKLGGELHAKIASQIHGVPTVGLRLFNVYGAGQNQNNMYSGVITHFHTKLTQGLPITLHGTGEQTRDFIYVADVVRYFLKSMQQQREGTAQIFNACTGKGVSIKNLAQVMAKLYQTELELVYSSARAGDIMHSLGDPRAAETQLGITAQFNLEQGLAQMLETLVATD